MYFIWCSSNSMSREFWLLILNLLMLSFQLSSASLGSRSILRAINNEEDGRHDYVVDLNATIFDSVLRGTPASFAVVEFFANWCPACRNYKSHYEKVARLFNGPDAVHPGIILMTRVDCASKVNTKLCDRFPLDHYPMLFWGFPSKFVDGGSEPKQEKSEIHIIDDGRTAERLLNWINKKMGSSYGLDDRKFENEHLTSNVSDAGQIAQAVYDVEEATTTAFEIILDHNMIQSETRASLIKFLQLLAAHHPSKRCRRGSAEVLVDFDDLYPSDMLLVKQEDSGGKSALGNFHICGKDIPHGYWMFCRGSRNETRGFSCGLWVLFHSLSVRIEDGESQFAFTAICDFVHNFFVCEECRQHFYDMCASVSSPFKKASDLVLWLWNAHNKVNVRLMKEEAALKTDDPKFPKMIWPPRHLCPSCSLSHNPRNRDIKWDNKEVFNFLTSYYGKMLVSLYKDNGNMANDGTSAAVEDSVAPMNVVVVPVGAALAIAIASCAFGALASYWRSQQKSWKYIHQLHSLKNI